MPLILAKILKRLLITLELLLKNLQKFAIENFVIIMQILAQINNLLYNTVNINQKKGLALYLI